MAICYALDYPSLDEAVEGAREVLDYVHVFKVGLELFVKEGPDAVRRIRNLGRPVFLDLKLHDIPETVERAVASAAQLGASFLTIHASGGQAMMDAAVRRASRESPDMRIVAVTVLTSMDSFDLGALGIRDSASALVERLARVAWSAGVRSFVSSPREVARLRDTLGSQAFLITPGIRNAGPDGDQKRVATATQAAKDGSDLVVIGRPIRDAASRAAAARAFWEEDREARQGGEP